MRMLFLTQFFAFLSVESCIFFFTCNIVLSAGFMFEMFSLVFILQLIPLSLAFGVRRFFWRVGCYFASANTAKPRTRCKAFSGLIRTTRRHRHCWSYSNCAPAGRPTKRKPTSTTPSHPRRISPPQFLFFVNLMTFYKF